MSRPLSARLLIAGFLLVVAVSIGLLVLRLAKVSGQSVLLDETLDGFRYVVNQDDVGSYFVYVFYDGNSVAGLKAYAAESRKQGERLIRQGVDRLYVEVTFNAPLSIAEFTRLVSETGMEVAHYNMRAIDGRGDRVGIQGSPRAGNLVPADTLGEVLKGIESQAGGQVEFQGFTGVAGMVTRTGYQKLLTHPRVFLVDVTVNLAYQFLRSRGRDVDLRDISLLSPPPFWFMEKMGLENFQ